MKIEFLTGLGIAEDVAKKIVEQSSKDIEKVELERDNYKSQFETAQNTLKEFDGVDIKELQGKITQLSENLTTKEDEYQQKIRDMEFNSSLDTLISSAGAKNAKALKALLDIDNLKDSKNQSADMKSAIEAVKAENDFLFTSAEPIKNPVASTSTSNITGITKELFSKMGYAERVKLKKANPDKYNEMKGE